MNLNLKLDKEKEQYITLNSEIKSDQKDIDYMTLEKCQLVELTLIMIIFIILKMS
jgi:hypothetical protein